MSIERRKKEIRKAILIRERQRLQEKCEIDTDRGSDISSEYSPKQEIDFLNIILRDRGEMSVSQTLDVDYKK